MNFLTLFFSLLILAATAGGVLPEQAPPPESPPDRVQPPAVPAGGDSAAPSAVKPPPPAPQKSGGVPALASGFHGDLEGAVETIDSKKLSFKIKITRVVPSAKNRAPAPAELVGAVVVVKQDYEKQPDGAVRPKPGHNEYIASLKPGDMIKISARYFQPANSLKLSTVPAPGTPAVKPVPAPSASAAKRSKQADAL